MTESIQRSNIKKIQARQRQYHAMGRCWCGSALQVDEAEAQKLNEEADVPIVQMDATDEGNTDDGDAAPAPA